MPVTDAERDALRESIGALSARERGFGVLVERDAPGRATVQVTGGDPARAASAVAVVKASWGWDEASLFEIQIGPELLEVRASYEGARWVADVRDGAGS